MAAPIARFANVCLMTDLFMNLLLLNWIGMFVKPSGSELAQSLRIFVLQFRKNSKCMTKGTSKLEELYFNHCN